jgi:hypothetical protein
MCLRKAFMISVGRFALHKEICVLTEFHTLCVGVEPVLTKPKFDIQLLA